MDETNLISNNSQKSVEGFLSFCKIWRKKHISHYSAAASTHYSTHAANRSPNSQREVWLIWYSKNVEIERKNDSRRQTTEANSRERVEGVDTFLEIFPVQPQQ